MSEVYHFKMITGEDVFGYFVAETSDMIEIRDPMVVEERENPESGNFVMILTKYAGFSDNPIVKISKSKILFFIELNQEYTNYYTISKVYNKKFIYPAQKTEIDKVVQAMESVLIDRRDSKSQLVKLNSNKSSNTSFH